MNREELINQILTKKSVLCVGLDTDINKLPNGVSKDMEGLLEFNKQIIKATTSVAVSYKINTAFYEQYGADGWKVMNDTLQLIPSNCFTIADAKRGDIGNTSSMYAKAFFEALNFDSITVAPYMGEDSIKPFLEYKDKWIICLALTSNKGNIDFQHLLAPDEPLYQKVIKKISTWGHSGNTMFVTGATNPKELNIIRNMMPEHFFLVPGVGAQGGTVEQVCDNCITDFGGILINASRSILYADNSQNYAEAAYNEALKLQKQMAVYL